MAFSSSFILLTTPSRASGGDPLLQDFDSLPDTDIPTSKTAVSSADQHHSSSSQGRDATFSGAMPLRPYSPPIGNTPNLLTSEQAAYVQNMYSLHVPAPVIALGVERMLQEGGATSESSTSSGSVRRANTTVTMPPAYSDS
jgi:hypothetical protein